MDLPPKDPCSYARPDLATVVYNILELFVDFRRKVLKGKIIITIFKKEECEEIILDNYQLKIIRVIRYRTNIELEYDVGDYSIFGSRFTIKLPHGIKEYRVQIDYETSTDSPALYWLTREQTSDGIYPFLISNSKLTFARAIFPCQDTPSVISAFFVKINVPTGLNVTVCGYKSRRKPLLDERVMHTFGNFITKIPSHAVVIVVGLLENINTNSFHLWAERKYIQESNNMCVVAVEILSRFQIFDADERKFSICVLPSNIPEFELQSPYVTLVSSTLLGGNYSLISTVIENILESWMTRKVIIQNFQHLWLIKSLRTFFYRKIIRNTLGENMVVLLEKKGFNNMMYTIDIYGDFGLIPDLTNVLPKNIISNIQYERGYIFLIYLEQLLDEYGTFYELLKFFIKSWRVVLQPSYYLNSIDFRTYLHNSLPNKIDALNSVNWNKWLCEPISGLDLSPYREITINCHILAEQWLTAPINKLYATVSQVASYHDLEKIEFLVYLCASPVTLPIYKLRMLKYAYLDDRQICEIRFHWLRLCIKSEWLEMVRHALEFACEYSMPKYAFPIFRDLYEWTVTRYLTISWFVAKNAKMLPETIRELESILN